MKRLKNILFLLFSAFLSGIILVLVLNFYINHTTGSMIFEDVNDLEEAHTVIILGASVHADGKLSPVLRDRVDTGFYLYRKGKVKRFLLTGDHRTDDYNEVSAMRNYLIKLGVPAAHIFTDPGGLNTYESMYRSREVYDVPSAIVVTQPFHLPRALFIARNLGLDYSGFPADSQYYKTETSLLFREKVANLKAVYSLINQKSPSPAAAKYPVSGSPQ